MPDSLSAVMKEIVETKGSMTWRAPEDRISHRAYHKYLDRNRKFGYEVHGFHDYDYQDAVSELSYTVPDKKSHVDLQIAMLGLRSFTHWDAIKWNQLAIKVCVNDYFPLLRNDELPHLGDRISPFHMLDLLIQRENIRYRDRGLTEAEFDELIDYRKTVDDVVNYCWIDYCERRGILATNLVKPKKDVPLHDVEYIWGGPYVCAETTMHGAEQETLKRAPKVGEELIVVTLPPHPAKHPTELRDLAVGDKIKINRLTMYVGLPIAWYTSAQEVDSGSQYVPLENCNGIGYTIQIPENWNPSLTVYELPARPPQPWRPKMQGLNVFGSCVISGDQFRYDHRMTPKSLATVIAMRFLGVITAQQGKVLIERVWDNFDNLPYPEGWQSVLPYDVFDLAIDLGMLEEVGSDLRGIVAKVLSENAQAVQDYKSGKQAAFGRLMGNAMKACKGCGKPPEVKVLLEEMLAA
jgi:hypothetical protein